MPNWASHIASHAAGMVIVRKGDLGRVEILLIDYLIRGQTTKRCLMGRQEGKTESPIDTLKREMREEALAENSAFRCGFPVKKPIIFTELVPDQQDSSGYHLKLFFLVEMREGVLRKDVLVEKDGLEEEVLGPPAYHEIGEVLDKLTSGEWKSKFAHVQAIKAALPTLVDSDPEIAARYSEVVGMYCRDVNRDPLTPMICGYLRRFK